MAEDMLAKNLEWSESRLIFYWRMAVGISVLYIAMFSRVPLNPDAQAKQSALADLTSRRDTAQRLLVNKYIPIYQIAGARAIKRKIEANRPLPAEMDSACRSKIPWKPTEEQLGLVLKGCATWELFEALLLDDDSLVEVELLGGQKRTRYDVRPNMEGRDESEVKSLPLTTGLNRVTNWQNDILAATEKLAVINSSEENQLRRDLSVIATGKFEIPIWDKVVDPLWIFWIGGLLLVLCVWYLSSAWDERMELLARLVTTETKPMSWETAVFSYEVKLPWMFFRSSAKWRDTVSRITARSLFVAVPAGFLCVIAYCWQYPSDVASTFRHSIALANIALGSRAVYLLTALWRKTRTMGR